MTGDNLTTSIGGLAIVGAMIGMGQLLASTEVLTWRIIIGRALSSAGLGVTAGAILLWYPGIHPVALAGIAALLASLGTSALERMVQKVLKV